MNKYLLQLLILVTLLQRNHCCGDHYWRDYEGVIPDDAIPAGRNSKGLSYMGKAYIHNYGEAMGTIIPGKWEMDVACWGVKKVDSIIQILCAKDKSKFNWISTKLSSYRQDTVGKCPILAGYDQVSSANLKIPLGTLHIGRTRQHGDVIIGNIAVYDKGGFWFYYPLNDEETRSSDYEVLVYTGDS